MEKITKRKCQGCFEIKDRTSLIKITKLQDGTLKINPNSKELGRSVYVCPNCECVKNFIKKKRLKNALKAVNMEEIEKIENFLKEKFLNN